MVDRVFVTLVLQTYWTVGFNKVGLLGIKRSERKCRILANSKADVRHVHSFDSDGYYTD